MKGYTVDIMYAKAAACIGAAFAMGFGGLGPALGQGMIGAKACESIGKYGEQSNKIRGAMFLAMAIVETSSLYCALVAGALIYFAFSLIG